MSELAQITQTVQSSYASGDTYKAEQIIAQALQKWPQDIHLLQLGVRTALSLNQVVTAHQRLDVLIAMAPMTAELANLQGRVHKASRNWAEAEEAYNLSEKLDPNFSQAKTNRLNLFIVSEQSKRVLEELESGYDYGEAGVIAKAQAYTDLGKYSESLRILDGFKSKKFADHITLQRVKCYAALSAFEEMISAFKGFTAESGLKVRALLVVMNAFEMRGLRDQSLSFIEHEMRGSSSAIMVEVVRLLRQMGEAKKAEITLKNLEREFPEDPDVLSEMASQAQLSKDANKSCDLYNQALSRRSGDFRYLCGYAQSAIMAGRYTEAQTLLQGALAQAPNDQFLLALVATLLRQTGQAYQHLYDYKRFIRAYDLSPPKGYSDMNTFNAALSGRLNELHVYENAPVNQTLRTGSQTELDLNLIDDPVLRSFFEAIDGPIRNYMESLGWDASHPLKRRNRNAYRISGAWSVKLKENGHHVNHVHPMGWISSAYYVDVPNSVNDKTREGWIQFGEPNFDIGQSAEHFVQPKSGRLVLFPSYMWHGTIPFKGTDTRLTLPFDVVPA